MGLWYDKFCDEWSLSWQELDKGKWINRAATIDEGKNSDIEVGNSDLIEDYFIRQRDLAMALGGQIFVFKTQDRFITGLGNPHPIENGFSWHFTLGTPYIPASSVKGVLRSWAETLGGIDSTKINLLFDSESDREHSAGAVIFFDAIPLSPVKLNEDIMTPHYNDYYRKKDNSPPADWYSPIPIPFLTVAEGQRFAFVIAPRKKIEVDIHDLGDWLICALEDFGLGAKTSSGYGRFEYDELATMKILEDLEKQRQEILNKQMSPIRREMEDDDYTDENKFMEAMTKKWLPKLKDPDMSLEDKYEIAMYLKEWYQIFRKEAWQQPKGKNVEKVKLIKSYFHNE